MLLLNLLQNPSIQKDEIYLNLVMEFVPETVYRVARHYSKNKQVIPFLYIKVSLIDFNVIYSKYFFVCPSSCTCISYLGVLHTCIRLGCAIEISSLRTFSLILRMES